MLDTANNNIILWVLSRQKLEYLRRRVDVTQVGTWRFVSSGFCPRLIILGTQHVHVSSPDGFRVSTVGLPSSSGGGQVSVSKTASTIVRNSNAAASAVDYANGSGLPFKTISVDANLSSVHAAPTGPSSNMTGETLH